MDLKTFQKRLEKSEKNVKQLHSFIAEASKAADAVRKNKKSAIKSSSRQIEKYSSKLEKKLNKACIKEINDLKADSREMEKQLDAVINEVTEAALFADKKAAQQIEQEFSDFVKEMDAAGENVQEARDNARDIDSLLLKAQMNVNAAEERIDGDLSKKDKAAQEALLAQLLDYADACQELIAVIALEAGQIILESALNPDHL